MNMNNVLYGEGWNPQPLGCESPAFTTRPRLQSIFIYFIVKPKYQLRKQLKKYQIKTCFAFLQVASDVRATRSRRTTTRSTGRTLPCSSTTRESRSWWRPEKRRRSSAEFRTSETERWDNLSSFSFKSKNWFFVWNWAKPARKILKQGEAFKSSTPPPPRAQTSWDG